MPRAAILVPLMLLAGCTSTTVSDAPKPVPVATDEQRAALIDRVKSLQGTWTGSGEGGMTGEIVFSVTSGGHVVREIMFPGTEHEMTNIYHMDGPSMVMTHYCAIGNQPRLRAAAASGNSIDFKCDGVSNLESADQMYMGHMTLTFVDKDHIEEGWQSLVAGKAGDHQMQFKLTRKH